MEDARIYFLEQVTRILFDAALGTPRPERLSEASLENNGLHRALEATIIEDRGRD